MLKSGSEERSENAYQNWSIWLKDGQATAFQYARALDTPEEAASKFFPFTGQPVSVDHTGRPGYLLC
jgi:hypothetical protein